MGDSIPYLARVFFRLEFLRVTKMTIQELIDKLVEISNTHELGGALEVRLFDQETIVSQELLEVAIVEKDHMCNDSWYHAENGIAPDNDYVILTW